MARDHQREEPTMRVRRLAMTSVSVLLILLSGVVWYQGVSITEYTVGQTSALHFLGHRMFYLQVRSGCACICVCLCMCV
jgi:hypothetical protein